MAKLNPLASDTYGCQEDYICISGGLTMQSFLAAEISDITLLYKFCTKKMPTKDKIAPTLWLLF